MDTLNQHEIFEIEVLDKLKSYRLLESLVFGGGSMLRLCHELNRYSVDLDFWFVKSLNQEFYFNKIQQTFEKEYALTDAQVKHFTILLELRSPVYPRRLKIEIRMELKAWDWQEKIAFSRFSNKQVLVKAHTLEQTMENKVLAFIEREEIRDCFDIEFMLRRGIELPIELKAQLKEMKQKLARLSDSDFKVKLGSILDDENREYYISNRFSYLNEKLTSIL